MAQKIKNSNQTWDSIYFVTPEQKVLRFLLSESTTLFTIRVLASRLKGVRGLGGAEGIAQILTKLEEVGLVEFVDNRRSVRLCEDHPTVRIGKVLVSLCDLESLRDQLEPLSLRGILFGSRAAGKAHTDSSYDLLVVTDSVTIVKDIVSGHPLGKQIELVVKTPDEFNLIEKREPQLSKQISMGFAVWGSSW